MKGRAEFIRLALAYGDIKFEDERFSFEEFASKKPSFPFGQVPVIEVDGNTYPQSTAVARYVSKLSGLYPSDALEILQVESVMVSALELFPPMVDIVFLEKDEEEKKEKTVKYLGETIPHIFNAVEKMIVGKYVLGEKITLADICLFDLVVNNLSGFEPYGFKASSWPKIEGIINAVKQEPKLSAYLAKESYTNLDHTELRHVMLKCGC